jgi:hypothetical protein
MSLEKSNPFVDAEKVTQARDLSFDIQNLAKIMRVPIMFPDRNNANREVVLQTL